MTDAIKVTVDGEPYSAEVTIEQVRAYLRAKGWWHHAETDTHHEYFVVRGDMVVLAHGVMSHAINEIARLERRSAAAVLREIAGEADRLGPWVRVVKAGAADVRVTVGSRVLCVERLDGQELAPEEHRAALAEALGAAVTALAQRGDRYATTDAWEEPQHPHVACLKHTHWIAVSSPTGLDEPMTFDVNTLAAGWNHGWAPRSWWERWVLAPLISSHRRATGAWYVRAGIEVLDG